MDRELRILTDQYLAEYLTLTDLNWGALILLAGKKEVVQQEFGYYLESSSVYSSNIEGNTIDFDTWLKNKAFKIKSKPKETAEIGDLLAAYHYASENGLSQKTFLETHRLLSKTILSVKSQRGKFRKQPVGIYSEGKLEYLAVEPELVQEEMDKLFSDILLLIQMDLSPTEVLYYASMIHLLFEKIHPFMDGNGRAGRLLEKWFISEKMGAFAWNLQTEKYYAQHRADYYRMIHIGLNYYVLKMERFLPFSGMLIEAVRLALRPAGNR